MGLQMDRARSLTALTDHARASDRICLAVFMPGRRRASESLQIGLLAPPSSPSAIRFEPNAPSCPN